MGVEEAPSGFLLTTIEDLAGYLRKASVWPVTFGLAGSTCRGSAWRSSVRRRGRPT